MHLSKFRMPRPAILVAAALAAFATGLSALAGTSTTTVTTAVAMPMHLDGTIIGSNNPGPEVTLSGALVFSGLDVKAIFRNNEKGTHEYSDTWSTSATLIPAGETITIPKQPAIGGTGGNPFVWVQFVDHRGTKLTEEIYIGRIVQGLTADIDPAFGLGAVATANVALDCANNPGPFITLNGGLVMDGLNVRFIFRNNDNPVGGPHETSRVVESTLIGAGKTIKFPKQPVLGGVGGNPWIYVQFAKPDGTALSQEYLVGRCVQGSK